MNNTFEKVSSELYHKGVKGMKWKNRKSDSEVAKEVTSGKYGNGSERIRRLKEAGYDPKSVQSIVNNGGKDSKNKDDKSSVMSDKKKENVKKYIDDVIKGKYGNGSARMEKLKKEGQDPDEVQHQVNIKLLGEKRANAIRDRKMKKKGTTTKKKVTKKTNNKSKKGPTLTVTKLK